MELKASSFFKGLANKWLSMTIVVVAMALVSLFWYGALIALLAFGVTLFAIWTLTIFAQIVWAVVKKASAEILSAAQKIRASVNGGSSVGEESFAEDEGIQNMDDGEEGDDPDTNEGMRIAAEEGELAAGFRSRRI